MRKELPIIVALVPMRHHSQRVAGKNYRPLAGLPLFHHILNTLTECPEITSIVVDTDSPEITKGMEQYFPQVIILERPLYLRQDDIPMNDILAYDTSQIAADFYLQTHSTNPLLKPTTISNAILQFTSDFPQHDSLFSVSRLRKRLWDNHGRAINHDPAILLQTQDLPPIFEENSCIYLFTKEILLRRRNRLGERPMMFEIDAAEAWDIDDDIDFQIAEFLLQRK